MPAMDPKIVAFLDTEPKWRAAFEALRAILLDAGLTETLKWGKPCYAHDGRNVALIHGFKDYCAILFMKGALLPDPERVLIRQTENVQSARQIRFADVAEVLALRPVLATYVREAIAVEASGGKVEFRSTEDFATPEELVRKWAEVPALKAAFEALTPGRQRGYLLHFAAPKQSATRTARIEKCLPRILDGKGLND